jgi:DNA-binding CsgD family transcriptional regulator
MADVRQIRNHRPIGLSERAINPTRSGEGPEGGPAAHRMSAYRATHGNLAPRIACDAPRMKRTPNQTAADGVAAVGAPNAGATDPRSAETTSGYPELRTNAAAALLGGNPAGIQALRTGRPLKLRDAQLHASDPRHRAAWQDTLRRALATRRALLCLLPDGPASAAISIVPDARGARATIRLQREEPCDPGSLAAFAIALGLTDAELRVLRMLVRSLSPKAIGDACGTSESTVRSQVRSLLHKSGHSGIRPLLLQIARLPTLD